MSARDGKCSPLLATVTLSAAVLAQTMSPAAESATMTIRPEPRTDRNSRVAHAQRLAKARQGRIDLYFVGDSITRRWGCSDPQYRDLYAHWRSQFFGWNAANFGWGGDTVQNILWRMENGELAGVHPKVIVLLAGTNNLKPGEVGEAAERRVRGVETGIRALLDSMQRQAPGATIVLMGLLPRNDPPAGDTLNPIVARINERLALLADGRRVRFLNLHARLTDREGRLLPGMTVDGLHLSIQGYQVWAEALKPILTELLGPPADTDLAPPPTGDPGLH